MGGPDGDCTLRDGQGNPLANDGHDYRLKNLFGWDLRGSEGIYGPKYQNKAYVLPINLLNDTRSTDELAALLTDGDANVPAFGAVLDPTEIATVVTFIERVRTGRLPRPDQVFSLSETAPNNYVLVAGADLARGAELYADACGSCHGRDGAHFGIDGNVSVGAYARTKAYEAWSKVLNGKPGSPMHREIEFSSGDDGAAQILSILAALCDREAFPPMPNVADVPDGDPRCGGYLR